MKIPVIINNRDLLTWTKKMVDKIKMLDDVGDIIIIDNKSTYEPLLDWYDTNPCYVIKSENIGHTAPWTLDIVGDFNHYVVTDSDLNIDNIPNDTLLYLFKNMNKFNLNKIGLGLDWKIIKKESPYFNHLMTYEKNRWTNSRFEDDIYFDVAIDTTFALYNIKNYFIGGASTIFPYVAKHNPWYYTEEERKNDDEFMYYLKNANSSCSYKNFLRL